MCSIIIIIMNYIFSHFHMKYMVSDASLVSYLPKVHQESHPIAGVLPGNEQLDSYKIEL